MARRSPEIAELLRRGQDELERTRRDFQLGKISREEYYRRIRKAIKVFEDKRQKNFIRAPGGFIMLNVSPKTAKAARGRPSRTKRRSAP